MPPPRPVFPTLPWGTPTEVIDLSWDSTPQPRLVINLEEPQPKRTVISPPSETPSYDLFTLRDHSQDFLIATKLHEEEILQLERQKKTIQEDELLALALATPAFEEVEVKEQTQIACNNDTMQASDIARLYAGDDHSPVNIHELFCHFDKAYFEGRLTYVSVKWSYQMKLCAGICQWSSRGAMYEVEIKLSEPLLKFRPRTDLIDTLLHEMIHAYLLITKTNEASREDHGPLFQAQMNRINHTAGTRITIYHSFFDEVAFYRQHWWKCNRCERIIKRSMNRAPGPHDRWFSSHKNSCGGEFIKFKEPEGFKPRGSKKKTSNNTPVQRTPNQPPLSDFFPGLGKRLRAPDT